MTCFAQLRLDGKPALIFASHLANWELPALAAVAHGLDAAILYRRPNIASADRAIQEMREVKMGTLIPAGRDAPLRLAEALQKGQHVAMLVDQYLTGGVEVNFFGRKTRANPMLARLLRQIECPVHGVRVIRLPGNRFRAELTEEIPPVRDADGKIDVQGTTQKTTASSKAGCGSTPSNGCGCTAAGARARRDWAKSPSRSKFMFEHDLRANALRLSRGKTASYFSGSCSRRLLALALRDQLRRGGGSFEITSRTIAWPHA